MDEQVDKMLRLVVVALGIIWLLYEGTVFENTYPAPMVLYYSYPWWRILLLILLAIGAAWCPRVGIVYALILFFYFQDMNLLTKSFRNSN